MTNFQIGLGIVAGLWALSMEYRLRRSQNQVIVAKQAETDAKIASAVRVLSDAERAALAESAVDRYSKD